MSDPVDARSRLESAVDELERLVGQLEAETLADETAAEAVSRVAALSGRIAELLPEAMRQRVEPGG